MLVICTCEFADGSMETRGKRHAGFNLLIVGQIFIKSLSTSRENVGEARVDVNLWSDHESVERQYSSFTTKLFQQKIL